MTMNCQCALLLYAAISHLLMVLLLTGPSEASLGAAPGQSIDGELMLDSEPVIDPESVNITFSIDQANLSFVLPPPGGTFRENMPISIKSNAYWGLLAADGNPNPNGKMTKYCDGFYDNSITLENPMVVSASAWEVELGESIMGDYILIGGSTCEGEYPDDTLYTNIEFKQDVTWYDSVLPESCSYRIVVNFFAQPMAP
jgi:hypothetical protein